MATSIEKREQAFQRAGEGTGLENQAGEFDSAVKTTAAVCFEPDGID